MTRRRALTLTITCRDRWFERLSFAWMILFAWPYIDGEEQRR